ncbi:Uncharacterised protein [Shigella sonnei]|nr:Uncharacterised protein [Shigella sonnei]CSF00009.1 Uncharacterised protein [Shigella sonnei]CSF51780.1 Uncharacterised protein [Shigella sonnei]CSF87802.1 Uncharacterised protein [Shigella sonnei]CSG33824.1 Uncharacterised protein [Shigella sonnei]
MHHLPGTVYPCVSTPGAEDGDGFVRHLGERLFQLLLHTADFILPLPAVILTAVVLNAQRNFINWQLLLVGH